MSNLSVLFHRPENSEWFKQVLDHLGKKFKFVSLEDIESYYHNGINLKNACHITFDDGELSVYENAFPVLKQKGIPASLYVSPHIIETGDTYWFQKVKFIPEELLRISFKEIISNDSEYDKLSLNQLLKTQSISTIKQVVDHAGNGLTSAIPRLNVTTSQLQELSDSDVFSIGAHTMNHPILKNETDEISQQEITESISSLEKIIRTKVKAFAYPNGLPGIDYGDREKATLNSKGIPVAFTCRYNFFNRKDHPLEIPRLEIEAGNTFKIGLKSQFPGALNAYVKWKTDGPYKIREKIIRSLIK